MGDPVPINLVAGIADLSPEADFLAMYHELLIENRAVKEALAAKNRASEYQQRIKAANAIASQRRAWVSLADINRLIDKHCSPRPITKAGLNLWFCFGAKFKTKKDGRFWFCDPVEFAQVWAERDFPPLPFESLPCRYL
jgi:hypothetical protein